MNGLAVLSYTSEHRETQCSAQCIVASVGNRTSKRHTIHFASAVSLEKLSTNVVECTWVLEWQLLRYSATAKEFAKRPGQSQLGRQRGGRYHRVSFSTAIQEHEGTLYNE